MLVCRTVTLGQTWLITELSEVHRTTFSAVSETQNLIRECRDLAFAFCNQTHTLRAEVGKSVQLHPPHGFYRVATVACRRWSQHYSIRKKALDCRLLTLQFSQQTTRDSAWFCLSSASDRMHAMPSSVMLYAGVHGRYVLFSVWVCQIPDVPRSLDKS